MKIGIRFCGGCNPRYNRRQAVENFIRRNAGHDYSIAEENIHYDLLLIIGGCETCCASSLPYDFDRDVRIRRPEDLEELVLDRQDS